jgi:hypothetical protein
VGLGMLDTTADAVVIAGARTWSSWCDAPRETSFADRDGDACGGSRRSSHAAATVSRASGASSPLPSARQFDEKDPVR